MPEPTTVRMLLMNRKGRHVERLSDPAINANSVVHISASEANISVPPAGVAPTRNPNPPGGIEGPPNAGQPVITGRFVGDADISVKDVAPTDGAVFFVLTVDWEAPLNVVVDITIFDGPAGRLVIGGGPVA